MRKAVIMAGGFGTRLRPLTCNAPKPMVPVLNVPMMERIVELLKSHSITEIASLLYFQPEKITSHFGNGSAFGVSMYYVNAVADYGTAGSVRNASEFLDEPFIVISGDVLTDFDLSAAFAFHREKQAKATIVLTKVEDPLQFGIVMTDDEGRITRFLEKPSWGEVFSDTINTGIYILEPEVLDLIPYQTEFDFSKDLYPLMLSRGMPLYGYTASGYWKDIGNLDQYQSAHKDALSGNVKLSIRGEKSNDVFLDEGAKVHDSAKLSEVVVIGENTEVGRYAEISNSVLGNNVVIGPGARIVNSVVWNNVTIGESAELTDDVVCNDTTVGAHSTIAENVFIADSCTIGDHAQLLSNIKLWPNKVVESRAILSRSLVQEEKWLRELFTDARVTGLSNIEMNPDFGAKFGAALGNALGAGSKVFTSRDPNPVSRMVKRAMLAGLISTGIDVQDSQITPLPITRQSMVGGSAIGGFHVRQSPYNPNHTDIILINSDGRDLSTSAAKKIERLFFGEDIKRVAPEQVGDITYPERATETYLNRYTSALQLGAIAERQFNIAVEYGHGMTSTIFPRILGELRCDAIGLNAYVDTTRSSRSEKETDTARDQMRKVIKSLGYEIGFMIDPGAEKISVVDSMGAIHISARLMSIVTKLFLEAHREREPYKIAVSVAATSDIAQMAAEYNVEIVWIKNSHSAMMDATLDNDVLFVVGTRGRFIFSDFYFAADAMFSIGKILEMLALTGNSFSELDATLPKRFQSHKEIACPWERKGTIMRRSMEYSEGKERQLVDGVKLFEDDANVLLIPDKERAIFHVLAESADIQGAAEIASRYGALVAQWRDE